MTTKLERIAKMEAELAALKKDVEAEGQWVSPVFYPKSGDSYEHLIFTSSGQVSIGSIGRSGGGCGSFPHFRPGTGQAFADAFQVMLELRACEGVIQRFAWCEWYSIVVKENSVEVGLVIPTDCIGSTAFPSYNSGDAVQAAINKIGADRIRAAAKTLANWREQSDLERCY